MLRSAQQRPETGLTAGKASNENARGLLSIIFINACATLREIAQCAQAFVCHNCTYVMPYAMRGSRRNGHRLLLLCQRTLSFDLCHDASCVM